MTEYARLYFSIIEAGDTLVNAEIDFTPLTSALGPMPARRDAVWRLQQMLGAWAKECAAQSCAAGSGDISAPREDQRSEPVAYIAGRYLLATAKSRVTPYTHSDLECTANGARIWSILPMALKRFCLTRWQDDADRELARLGALLPKRLADLLEPGTSDNMTAGPGPAPSR